jgi:hypothetical protein
MCKLYLLFISANAAQEKEEKENQSAAAHTMPSKKVLPNVND